MLKRNLTILVATFAMAALLSFGCGGSGGGNVPEEWTGPTSTVIIEGRGDVRGLAMDADGNVLSKDASDTTTGSGDGVDGVDSILDTANVMCLFMPITTTDGTGIHIVDNILKCTVGDPSYIPGASLNKCIVCTHTYGATCELTCNGTVPSNAETAADWIRLKIKISSDFTSDMPVADGVIRVDGDTSLWPAFDPSGVSSFGVINHAITQCDGTPDMLATADDPLLIDDATATSWSKSYSIDELGDGTCLVESYVWGRLLLTGADTPGAVVNLTDGSFTASAKICDDVDYCAVP